MASFKYDQKLKRRVISDTTLERFPMEYFNFDTKYVEPFQHTSLSVMSQTFIPKVEVRPQRLFDLQFKGLKITDESCVNLNKNLDFNVLYDFYLKHGTYKNFIFEHPVYGDLIVRFGKTISVPKKIKNGLGALESFNILLVEKITTEYTFANGEDLSGDFPAPFVYFDAEVDIEEDTLIAPLGSNYEMVFIRAKKPLRKFKITLQGLKYYWYDENTYNLSCRVGLNLGLLELFYLKHRLNKSFKFHYLGEDVRVRFSEPLMIPKIESQTGVILSLDIILIETPNVTLDEELENQRIAAERAKILDDLLKKVAVDEEGLDILTAANSEIIVEYAGDLNVALNQNGLELEIRAAAGTIITLEY